jgi:hypothetical protein
MAASLLADPGNRARTHNLQGRLMSPRPILRPADGGPLLRQDPASTTNARPAPAAGTISLARRTPRFTAAIKRLDAGDLQASDLDAIMDAIAEEYPIGAGQPLGLVAECFLGAPFEVHVLDLIGGIVEHFELGRPMPHPLERARALAVHPAYDVIEVYDETLVCVRSDGSVTEMRM